MHGGEARGKDAANGMRLRAILVTQCLRAGLTSYAPTALGLLFAASRGWREMLSRAIDRGFFCYPAMVRDPWLDPLRARSEFTNLLRKSNQLHRDASAAFLAAGGDSLLGIRAEGYMNKHGAVCDAGVSRTTYRFGTDSLAKLMTLMTS
jgi:hypothetical protein